MSSENQEEGILFSCYRYLLTSVSAAMLYLLSKPLSYPAQLFP